MDDGLRERIAEVLADYEGPEHTSLRAVIAELVAHHDRELARRDVLIDTLTIRLSELEAQVAGLERATKRQAWRPARRHGPDPSEGLRCVHQ